MTATVNEKNAKRIDAWLFDEETGLPILPTTCEWRLDCLTTDQMIQDWTATTVDAVYDESGALSKYMTTFSVSASLNTIRDDCNRKELKQVLIVADRDLATEWSTHVEYYVINLHGRT